MLLTAEAFENVSNKMVRNTYRKELLLPALTKFVWVFRDLFVTVINRATLGRWAAVTCVPRQGIGCCSLQAHSTVPSAHSPKLSAHRSLSHHSTAVSLRLLPSRGVKLSLQHLLFSYQVRIHGKKNQAARL